jgi:hypothetical protein
MFVSISRFAACPSIPFGANPKEYSAEPLFDDFAEAPLQPAEKSRIINITANIAKIA